jgi:hypothetical protein
MSMSNTKLMSEKQREQQQQCTCNRERMCVVKAEMNKEHINS